MPEKSVSIPEKSQWSEDETIAVSPAVVAIGASSDALDTIKVFFTNMPVSSGMAYVLVFSPDLSFEEDISEVVRNCTSMPLCQVKKQQELKVNHIYTIAPGANLSINKKHLVPSRISKTTEPNLPIDCFFTSLAASYKDRSVAIILSGTKNDGFLGAKAIKKQGGIVLVQDPKTTKQNSLLEKVIATGLINRVLKPEQLSEATIGCVTHPEHKKPTIICNDEELYGILSLVQTYTHYDFGCYKRNTLIRRIERRMGMKQIDRVSDYMDYLKGNQSEIDLLYQDLLIGVTGFFRESQVWETLEKEILFELVHNKKPENPIRIWVPGCSTGEEPYTIAILLQELFSSARKEFNAQIFATDIDEKAINFARKGVFPESIVNHISPDRLRRYFNKDENGYRIIREIRENVVFAVQNLIGDAPFPIWI